MTTMNLVTPKAAAEHDLLFNEPASGFGFNGIIATTLVTPKAVTKHELLFNKPLTWGGFVKTSKSDLSSTTKC